MSGPLKDLDGLCGTCQRVVGDHTMYEWSECIGTVTTDLPYEGVPADVRRINERFGLPEDTIVADHVIAKALVAQAAIGPFGQSLVLPVVMHEFSRSPAVADVVARVAYLGDTTAVRQYGRLLRDTANGAANAAERSAA